MSSFWILKLIEINNEGKLPIAENHQNDDNGDDDEEEEEEESDDDMTSFSDETSTTNESYDNILSQLNMISTTKNPPSNAAADQYETIKNESDELIKQIVNLLNDTNVLL